LQLRKHQADFLKAINAIISGDSARKILIHAIPGSGKSMIPIAACKLIDHGLVDALCWAVPRTALQKQGEQGFLDEYFRKMLNHKHTIRSSTNEVDPCRGLSGFVTTIQSLAVDSHNTVLNDFKKRRYVLILDENHHFAEDSLWAQAVQPLIDNAKYLIMMSGTLQRGDKQPIAWIPYRGSKPAIENSKGTIAIRYGRTLALTEKAILPLEFMLSDGRVEWKDRSDLRHSGKLSEMVLKANEALFTALNTQFADELLQRGMAHWHNHKIKNPRSKILIVTSDLKTAKNALKHLVDRGVYAKIATSHDSPDAMKNIDEFKFGRLGALVCIAMCYEGLDCPPATHIISLTHVRSQGWIEQMVARVVRIDRGAGPYEQQRGYIFAPDDFLFRQVVTKIEKEQLAAIRASMESITLEETESTGENGEKEPDVIPIGSSLTGDRSIFLGGPGGYQEPAPMPKTPTEIEADLRTDIEEHIRRYCYRHHIKIQKINARIKKETGKARAEMTLKELEKTIAFVKDRYPLDRKGRGPGSVISNPRPVVCAAPVQGELWGNYSEWRV